MKPVDLRNETWESLQTRVTGLRQAVLLAYRQHGPGTTRELAKASGIDLLSLRPRVTELVDLGFMRLVRGEGGEGIYEALTEDQAIRHFLNRIVSLEAQPELNLILPLAS